jgi:hypothetical protein
MEVSGGEIKLTAYSTHIIGSGIPALVHTSVDRPAASIFARPSYIRPYTIMAWFGATKRWDKITDFTAPLHKF